jgi:hypothetical protein
VVVGSASGCVGGQVSFAKTNNGFVEGRRSPGEVRGAGDSWRVVAALLTPYGPFGHMRSIGVRA